MMTNVGMIVGRRSSPPLAPGKIAALQQ